MEAMIYQFARDYGLMLFLIALSGIVFLGILKFFKVFDKIEKSKRKYIYAAISALFSIVASILYLLYTEAFTWNTIIVLAPAVYALNQCAYSLYETSGARAFFRVVGNSLINIIAGNRIEEKMAQIEQESGDTPESETSATENNKTT